MPPATRYYDDPNTPEARALEELASNEHEARVQVMRRNWLYYEGKHRKPLLPDKSGVDDNVILNKMRLIVNKAVSSLMGTTDQGAIKGPDFDVVDRDETQEEVSAPRRLMRSIGRALKPKAQPSDNQKRLDAIWKANKKAIFLQDMGVSGANTGHVYVKLLPDGAQDPDTGEKNLPRFILLNPENCTVFWDAEDITRVLWYRYEYEYETGARRVTRVREDTVRNLTDKGEDMGSWRVVTYEATGSIGAIVGKWTEKTTVDWPFPWSPVHAWKNQPAPFSFYGQDDIRETGNVQDGLNFTASNIQRIIKYHAAPRTIGTGFEAEDIQETAVNRFYSIAAADAKVYNLEMQSDLSSSMAYVSLLESGIFDSAGQLNPRTVQDKLGAITNFGLRVLNQDSLQVTGTKRLLYGEGLVELCQHGLETVGVTNAKVEAHWPDPLPTDPFSTAQALDIDRRNGLSQETYLERRGYDPEAEAINKENERGQTIMDETIKQQGNAVEMMRRNGGQTNAGQQQFGGNGGTPAVPGNGLERR